MGVLSDSNISISKDKKIKIQELNKNDTILSVKNKEGLLNYKYYGRSIQLSHIGVDLEYNHSSVHYDWSFKAKRYRIINKKLKISFDHIIFVLRDNVYTWDYVKSLKIGDKLLTEDLLFEEIQSIEDKKEEKQFYSLNLSGFYNYFCEGYLLHNAGLCDQDLSYSRNAGDDNSVNLNALDLPAGSCAYCGIDDRFFWIGPQRWDTDDEICLPPPKYINFETNSVPLGLLAKGPSFVYRKMPRKWYDRSQLRINNRLLNKYYHIYLNTEGNWDFTVGDSLNDQMPDPSTIQPHNLTGFFDDGETGAIHGGSTGFSRLDSFHSYLSGGVRVLLDDNTNENDWITYGSTNNNNVLHNAQNNQSGNILYAENTTDNNGKGGSLNHWGKVRFCFTIHKTSTTNRTISNVSFNGTNTQSYAAAFSRWRFINMKGGVPGDPHPFSSNPTTGGKSDAGDDYLWGANYFVCSLDTLSE